MRAGQACPTRTRLVLCFADGTAMAYVDQRRIGSIRLTDDPRDFVAAEGLGPDALAMTATKLRDLLANRRGGLKSALMDQALIAGIGSIYSDGILFQARLHPNAAARGLDESGRRLLHRQLRRVLRLAIDRHADPTRLPRGWLLPNREDGVRCPRRNGTIRRLRIGGRASFSCPACRGTTTT